jgi:hypothetical protein
MLLNDTLYDVLCGNSKSKVKPDVFVNNYRIENGNLIFDTLGRDKTKFFVCKYYIPFSSSGILLSDYKNGFYTVNKSCQILVLSTPSPSDMIQMSISGVYAMDNTQFNEVFLDDNLNIIPPNKLNDTPYIKRYDPISISPNNSMSAFFNSVKNGEIKLNF